MPRESVVLLEAVAGWFRPKSTTLKPLPPYVKTLDSCHRPLKVRTGLRLWMFVAKCEDWWELL